MQEGKVVIWEGFTNSWKKKKSKGNGEKERCTQMNAREDKKTFLSEWCKEIEENNRMGNTRFLFKKIRDIKGIFHVRMGTIKDRNGKDLTEAKEIKKRWQEYKEGLYKNRY